MRRKLFAGCVFMTAGVAAARQGPLMTLAGMIFPLAAGGVFSFSKRQIALFLLVPYLAGACLMAGQFILIRQGSKLDGEEVRKVQVRVLSVDQQDEEKVRLVCRLINVSGHKLPRMKQEKMLLTWYGVNDKKDDGNQRNDKSADPLRLIGSELQFSAAISAPGPATNPRCFDYRIYLYGRGIHHVASVSAFRIVSDRPTAKERAVRRVLQFRESFLQALPCDDTVRGIVRGICFGDTDGMEEDIYEDFRANGTAHVLAVSGLHIGVLFALWRRLKLNRRKGGTVLLVTFLLFYGTMALWSPSVTRAVLLVLLVIAADLLDRRYDFLTSIAAAAVVMMVHQPYVVFSTGFQMSFLAVASMAFLCPVLERHIPQWAAAAVAVQVGMFPYIAYTFNYIPLAALLINIPVLWMMGVLIPTGVAVMGLFLVLGTCGPGGPVLCGLTEILIRLNGILALSGRFAADVASLPLWAIVLGYGIMFYFASEQSLVWRSRRDLRRSVRSMGLVTLMTLLIGAASQSPFDRAVFVMVDVGQGDCLHIRDGRLDLLIDGGGKEEYNIGEKVLKPYLLKNGCPNVDLALATHLHTDHFLGLQQLAECYPVKKLMTEGQAGDVIELPRGDRIELLWPRKRNPDTDDENENSLIFKVTVRGISILVTGDLTEEGEAALVERYRGTDQLHCDILKVCHHGSRYSSTDRFLDAVSPRAAVIGVGKNNYGHPAPETLEKFKARGIPVYRTDLDGAVGFWMQKGKLQVCTMLP